jgi:NADPH:quinone reductase-like Zn-dependent oxidoreductase
MHAFAVDDYGFPGTYRDVSKPRVLPNEALIRVRAAGVNPIDVSVLSGAMKDQSPATFPLIPGADMAGTVEEGGLGTLSPGDEVFGRVVKSPYGAGTYAEYVTAPPASIIVAKPPSISFEQAAALPIPGMAALAAVDQASPGPGDTVLVVGATGGVGGYAVQIAALRGAHVIGTAGSDAEDYVKRLGAQEVVDYRMGDVASPVLAIHPDGIDVLIDSVSDSDQLNLLAGTVRPGGRIVSTVFAADVEALARRGSQATNVRLSSIQTAAMLEQIAGMVEAGDLAVLPVTTFPLHRAGEAVQAMVLGGVRGKIVLSVPEGQRVGSEGAQ